MDNEEKKDGRREFTWHGDRVLGHLIRTAQMKPINHGRIMYKRANGIRAGDYTLRDGDVDHEIHVGLSPTGSRQIKSDSPARVYRLLRLTEKATARPSTPREITKPVLPHRIFDIMESEVLDFYDAIDALNTTKGFGNVGMILTGPAGVGKTETMRWLGEVIREKYNRYTSKISYSQLRKMLADGNEFDSGYAAIFIDDIDSNILLDRKITNNPLTSQFLTCLDGLEKCEGRLIVISTNEEITTSGERKIDPALIRPGRFEHIIDYEYPNADLIDQFCEIRGIEMNSAKFEGWSFARMDMFYSKFRVANYRHGTSIEGYYEKFIAMHGELDSTVEAYAEADWE